MLNYKPYVPKTIDQVLDQLAFVSSKSPTFADPFFRDRNGDSVFTQLSAGLLNIRKKVGEERYKALTELSLQVREHFEADPDESNDRTHAGRLLIREMQAIIRRKGQVPREGQ